MAKSVKPTTTRLRFLRYLVYLSLVALSSQLEADYGSNPWTPSVFWPSPSSPPNYWPTTPSLHWPTAISTSTYTSSPSSDPTPPAYTTTTTPTPPLEASPSPPPCPALPPPIPSGGAADDLYGLGTRIGIYLQCFAFLIGFLNVLRLDPKSQFSAAVLAFAILVKWFAHLRAHTISAAELWIGLALLLLVSAPGMWLLFWTLEVQRRKWLHRFGGVHGKGYSWKEGGWRRKRAFAEVTRGSFMNILQALVVFLWTVVANSWFSYGIIGAHRTSHYPPLHPNSRNVIWLGKSADVDAVWVNVVLITQTALGTICTAVPCFVYVLGVAFALVGYWFPTFPSHANCPRTRPLLNTEDELDTRTRLETKKWTYSFGGGLFVLCLFLLLSVELTIRDARLRPNNDVSTPGQLLPLIAGAVSLISSAADALGYHVPKRLAELERRVFLASPPSSSSSSSSSSSVDLPATHGRGKHIRNYGSVSDVSNHTAGTGEYCAGAIPPRSPDPDHRPRTPHPGNRVYTVDVDARSVLSRDRSISRHRRKERDHDTISLRKHHSDVSIHRHGSEVIEHRRHDDVSVHRHRDGDVESLDVEGEERMEVGRVRDFAFGFEEDEGTKRQGRIEGDRHRSGREDDV